MFCTDLSQHAPGKRSPTDSLSETLYTEYYCFWRAEHRSTMESEAIYLLRFFCPTAKILSGCRWFVEPPQRCLNGSQHKVVNSDAIIGTAGLGRIIPPARSQRHKVEFCGSGGLDSNRSTSCRGAGRAHLHDRFASVRIPAPIPRGLVLFKKFATVDW